MGSKESNGGEKKERKRKCSRNKRKAVEGKERNRKE
jgi:hypothetical protein